MKWIYGFVILSFVSFAGTDPNCADTIAGMASFHAKSLPAAAQYRQGITHGFSDGTFLATTPARETHIQNSLIHQKEEHEGKLSKTGAPDTPPIIVVPIEGTSLKFTQPWEEYGDMHADITGTSVQDGVLKATVLLPVSAHGGLDAKTFAVTDTYDLSYVDASGKKTVLVPNAKSLDFVTINEVEIPLTDGKPVTLYYDRHGSGGPGGYSGGRILHLTWRKSDTTVTPTDTQIPFWAAEEYQKSYPNGDPRIKKTN